MLKYREDIEKVVTKEEIQKRNEIVKKVNERGYVLKGEASFLLSFDKKTRVCNTCGKTFKESGGWVLATAMDKSGRELNIGLFENCFDCNMKEIMEKNFEKEDL